MFNYFILWLVQNELQPVWASLLSSVVACVWMPLLDDSQDILNNGWCEFIVTKPRVIVADQDHHARPHLSVIIVYFWIRVVYSDRLEAK